MPHGAFLGEDPACVPGEVGIGPGLGGGVHAAVLAHRAEREGNGPPGVSGVPGPAPAVGSVDLGLPALLHRKPEVPCVKV